MSLAEHCLQCERHRAVAEYLRLVSSFALGLFALYPQPLSAVKRKVCCV